MPTASVAGAAKHGHVLPSAVLGRAPSAGRKKDKGKENGPGSTPSFPPPPRDPKKQHVRGRGQPPASSMASLSAPPEDPPEDEDSALNANNWGASDPAIFAQLERELGSLRDQLALRQQISGARRRLMEVPQPCAEVDAVLRNVFMAGWYDGLMGMHVKIIAGQTDRMVGWCFRDELGATGAGKSSGLLCFSDLSGSDLSFAVKQANKPRKGQA